MWVFKDDHTDVRVLGTIAKRCRNCLAWRRREIHQRKAEELPQMTSARTAFERFSAVDVKPGQGNPKNYSSSTCPAGAPCAPASPSRASPRRPLCGPGDQRTRRLPAGPQRAVQKYSTRIMRRSSTLRLAPSARCAGQLPGCVFRRHPGRNLRRQSRSLLRLRHLRSSVPGQGLHQDGQRVEFHDNNSQWVEFKKDKGAYLKSLEATIQKAEPIEKRTHGFRYRVSIKNRSPRP